MMHVRTWLDTPMQWLLAVEEKDPVRYLLNKVLAHLIVAWFAVMLGMTAVLSMIKPERVGLYLACLAVLIIAWWFNSKGSAGGAYMLTYGALLILPFILHPEQAIGLTTPVNILFFVPVLIASLFISVQSGIRVALITVLLVGGYLLFKNFPMLMVIHFLLFFMANLIIPLIPIAAITRFWMLVFERTEYRHQQELEDIIHDLSKPAKHVRRYLEMIAESPQALAKLLPRARQHAHQLVGLAEDLRCMIQPQQHTLPLNPTRTNITELIQAIIKDFEFDERRCTFVFSLSNVPDAWCDAGHIYRVLANIIENAVKYTFTYREIGEGRINITCGTENQHLVIRISDNGCGISPEDMRLIGQRFTRLANGDSDGIGIGLHLCFTLVQKNGGQLYIESAGQGQGTTVIIHLPIAYGNEAHNAAS